MRMRARGFTLVDLAVVLGCVFILFFLVWPTLTRHGEPTPRACCKNNLNQIVKACIGYSSDNGEFWPAQCDNFGLPDSDAIHLHGNRSLALIYPAYLDEISVFRCPSTKDKPRIHTSKEAGARRTSFGGYDRTKGTFECASYGYDQFIHSRQVTPDTVAVGDMDGSSSTDHKTATANHETGQCLAFFDAHVSWFSTNYASNNKSDNIYSRDGGEAGGAGISRMNWWGADTDVMLNRFLIALTPDGRRDVHGLEVGKTDCPRARKGEWSAEQGSRP